MLDSRLGDILVWLYKTILQELMHAPNSFQNFGTNNKPMDDVVVTSKTQGIKHS